MVDGFGRFLRIASFCVVGVFAAVCSAFPAHSQILRGNLRDEIPNADPAAFNGLIGHRLLSLVYEGLTAVSPDGGVAPGLATHWETPDDGRTWRFHLRRDVRFHGGRPFTAADVRTSFETALTAKRPPITAHYLENIQGRADFVAGRASRLAGVVELDPATVELRFDEPAPVFPYYPTFVFDGGARAEWGDGWHAAHSGGTGPFRLAEWRRGREVRLEANDDYWKGTPAVRGLRFLSVPSVDAALAMFDRDELDFVLPAEPAHRLLAGTSRYGDALQAVERKQVRFLGMNAALYPPFADVRVRRAVSLALDRRAVAAGLYGGLAATPRGVGVSALLENDGATTQTAEPPENAYDPDAARRLLAEAGYPGGAGLPPLELAMFDAARDEGGYYVRQLEKELGFAVRLRPMERGALLAAAGARSLAFFFGGWTADFPEPLTYLDALWRSDSRYNHAGWRDQVYDDLVERARRSADAAERRRLYADAEIRLADTAAAVILPTPFNLLLRNAAARDVRITPLGYLVFLVVARDAAGGGTAAK